MKTIDNIEFVQGMTLYHVSFGLDEYNQNCWHIVTYTNATQAAEDHPIKANDLWVYASCQHCYGDKKNAIGCLIKHLECQIGSIQEDIAHWKSMQRMQRMKK